MDTTHYKLTHDDSHYNYDVLLGLLEGLDFHFRNGNYTALPIVNLDRYTQVGTAKFPCSSHVDPNINPNYDPIPKCLKGI